MEKKIAEIISVIFHPLLMPTYVMAILLNLQAYFALIIPTEAKWRILAFVFAITFAFPALLTYFMIKAKLVKTIYMKTREDRVFPLIMTLIFFYLAYYLIKGLNISPVYSYFTIGATFVALLALILNFFFKISIHMLAMGAVFGTLLGTSLVFYVSIPGLIFTGLIIAGITAYARLKLQAHKSSEVYIGFLTGTIVMLGLILFI
jgi:hypothetical protein